MATWDDTAVHEGRRFILENDISHMNNVKVGINTRVGEPENKGYWQYVKM